MAPDVDIDHLVPAIVVGINNVADLEHPGIVDEDVRNTQSCCNFRGQFLDLAKMSVIYFCYYTIIVSCSTWFLSVVSQG